MTAVRGIRGAVTVGANSKEAITSATRELLAAIVRENQLLPDDIAGIMFTATPDLTAEFPAYAVRGLHWPTVPLICAQEIDVPGAMRSVVRVLLLVNTTRTPQEIKHQYLREARQLRPDLTEGDPV